MAEPRSTDEADDIKSLTAVIQRLAADYSHSDVRLVVIEGTKLWPQVLAAATGHHGLCITCVGVVRRAAVLSHGRMDDAGLRQLQLFAARAGAWLVATGQASDLKGHASADVMWWTLLHYLFADRNKMEIDGQKVWVHDPLLGSLEALAKIRYEDATAKTSIARSDSESASSTDDARARATANERMKAELAANLETVKGWTARQWARHLGYRSASTITDTPTWKELALLREKTKAETAMDRHRKAKPRKR